MHSGSFDRAAHSYDETRGFPPGIAEVVADAAVGLLGGGSEVMDVGVGTGRIAKPLLARGVRVTGVDLSRKMMDRLRETLPLGAVRPRLIEAAAEALPVASGRFDGVISVHVFHLMRDWRAALREARRVLRPGGILLSGHEWRPPDAPSTRLMERWRAIVRAKAGPREAPGGHDFADIKAALLESGAAVEERRVGEWVVVRSLGRLMESIEHRTWSSTWQVPDDFFPICLAELRAWAQAELGGPEREFEIPHRFVWERFSWE